MQKISKKKSGEGKDLGSEKVTESYQSTFLANSGIVLCNDEDEDEYPESVREGLKQIDMVMSKIASRTNNPNPQPSTGPSLRSGNSGRGRGRGV